jgi:hypothetical protein
VPSAAVEREADERAPARGAEAQRQQGAQPIEDNGASPPLSELAGRPPVGELAAAPRGVLHPRLILGLQGMAGNAAVASLIRETQAAPPEPTAGEDSQGFVPDDELAALDAAADAPAVQAEAAAEGERELVAQDAQAELEQGANSSGGDAPEAGGGVAEPGVPIEARPQPAVPDVGAAEPAAGLARVGGLPPSKLLGSLGAVSGAVGRHADQEHQRLIANPPQRPRHPGAPSTVQTPASTRRTLTEPVSGSIAPLSEGRDIEVRPQAAPPTGAPRLPLVGNADPAAVQQQHSHILSGLVREHTAGQREVAQPMGEDELFPTVPAETLRATIAAAPGANGDSPGAPPAGDDDEAASIIAQQEKGGEIQSAVSRGLATLGSQRQEYGDRTAGERTKADTEMAQLEEANAAEQAGERAAAKREVLGLRRQWTSAQQELVAGAQREADAKTSETLATVAQERGAAERQAATQYEQGQREADQARREGEQQAAAERQKAQNQNSGGLLGAIGSAAQSLFDKAKQAVQFVFDKAKQLVRSAIERAQQLATAVLEGARKVIAGAIRVAGVALTAIGDRVLVAFPAIRNQFRAAILARVAAAEAAVNKLAGALKGAVQTALTVLGAALSAAIALWRRGMQAAIDGVRLVVRGALDFARGAIAALGTFAVLVKDIAADPVRWVSNLAAAARDGIRNHLWPNLKAAVQGWFAEKVDGVLGLGSTVWSLLRRGGITVAQVAIFAWEGIKSMIPQMVIWVLIEKLVALIVPAAAAVMLIIQALQAAWGSLGRILQAFDAFVAFLKGVRWGDAGPLLGGALAAAAVAVIEFISQFLLQRLMSAAGAVAGKIRALAKRIGTRLASLGGRLVRGARRGWTGAGRLVGAASRAVKKARTKAGDKWFKFKNRRLVQKEMAWIDAKGDRCIRHGPMNRGPLEGHFESSFRSSAYTSRRLGQPRDLYRVYSDPVRRLGAFWTDVQPSGPLQATMDAALLPGFGNAATKVVHIRVPAGQVVYEGLSARQEGWLGGGTQYVLPKALKVWEVP